VSATGGRSEARSTCARRDDQVRSGLRWLVRPGEQQSCPTKRLTHRVTRADPRPHDVRGRKVPSPSPRPARTSKPPAPGATQLTPELTSRNTRVDADAAFPMTDTCWAPTSGIPSTNRSAASNWWRCGRWDRAYRCSVGSSVRARVTPRPLPWLGREANRGGATDSGLIMGSVRVRLPPKPYDDSSSEFLPGSPRIRRYRPRAKKVGLGDAQCTGTP